MYMKWLRSKTNQTLGKLCLSREEGVKGSLFMILSPSLCFIVFEQIPSTARPSGSWRFKPSSSSSRALSHSLSRSFARSLCRTFPYTHTHNADNFRTTLCTRCVNALSTCTGCGSEPLSAPLYQGCTQTSVTFKYMHL